MGLGFHSICRREFAVPVRLGAQRSRMQFAAFVNGSSTGGTRDRHDLLWGEFTAFHPAMMKDCASKECSILLKVPSFAKRWEDPLRVFYLKVVKSDHLARMEL